MTDGLLPFTLRELSTIVRAPRLWGTFLVVVLIFTITGPFGTDLSIPVAVRFFYWLCVQFAGWSTAIVFSVLANVVLERFTRHAFTRMMTGAVIASLPIGLWISVHRLELFGQNAHNLRHTRKCCRRVAAQRPVLHSGLPDAAP